MTRHIPSVKYSALLIVTLLSFALILSACGGTIETDLTLYSGDRFDATSRITTPVEGLMLVGGVEAIESQFKELEQQATAEGVKFSWRTAARPSRRAGASQDIAVEVPGTSLVSGT
jgi:hypothetical protein